MFVFSAPKVNNWPRKSKVSLKFADFDNFEGSFSKLFWSSWGSVYALLLTLKSLLFGVFFAPKIDKWHHNSKFSVNNLLIFAVLRGHFWQFRGVKKSRCLDLLKVVWEFRKCLGNVFSFERPSFSPLRSREALKNVEKASPGSLFEHDY